MDHAAADAQVDSDRSAEDVRVLGLDEQTHSRCRVWAGVGEGVPAVRDAIAADHSTVDMSDVLDGGICLVRIPKGSLGEETTRLVGSLVVARTWEATTGRARTPQPQRRDASLVIDECHFLNLPYPIEDMLAEAR